MDNPIEKRNKKQQISRSIKDREKQERDSIAEAVREFMNTSQGRKAMWYLCKLDSVFAGPYTNNAIATAYTCGQQIAAIAMGDFMQDHGGLDLYHMMEREMKSYDEEKHARRNN